ncbi:MAG: hypothetical protein A2X42_10370 [Candidatus Margulisbacteria bacterium GWF2_38_17]|nr:MAG: hypothetical protein A2X42_10370 [Candidatus Margulisbacteria bacterium GWF2_38_17]
MFSKDDYYYMRKVLKLAAKGIGITSPDPLVGAILVKEGRIIASGYHKECGTPHAEVVAINKIGRKAEGATLYVNLEPCCHWGNNPPCTLPVISNGIKRVVVGMKDPNPLVKKCDSAKVLRDAGIQVDYGCLENESRKLNEIFVKYITTGLPFVILKSGMSLDGKIATASGASKWITSQASRLMVHKLRSMVDAILVGIGTVIQDDPELTVRDVNSSQIKDPVRVIIDSSARIPLNARVLNLSSKAATIVVVTELAAKEKITLLEEKGAIVIKTKALDGKVNLSELITILGERKLTSLMVEGGGTINSSFFNAGIIDKVLFFIAPKIIGGKDSPTPIDGAGILSMADVSNLNNVSFTQIGDDILVEGYISSLIK